jgi:hypothetical protein
MTITDEYMSSEHTSARGWPSEPSQPYGEWAVSWCLERVLTRNQAITAMVLAEEVAACAHTGKTWLFIEAHADELGLPVSTAVKWLGRTV